MNYAEVLVRALGAPTHSRQPSPKDLKALAGKVPSDLVTLWRDHGWAGYGSGMWWTVDPRDFEDLLPRLWRAPSPGLVFGRDAFANLYMLSKDEVHLFNVHTGEPAMVASSLRLFFPACLDDRSFRKSYMWSALFTKALKLHGPLEADECYAFFPALRLGGSREAKALKRVKYKEHLDFLAQVHDT